MFPRIALIARSLIFSWQLILEAWARCFAVFIFFLLITLTLLLFSSHFIDSSDMGAFSNSIVKVFTLLPILLMALYAHDTTLQSSPKLFKILHQVFIQNILLFIGLGLMNAIVDWLLLRVLRLMSASFNTYLELAPEIMNRSATQESVGQFNEVALSSLIYALPSTFVNLFFLIALVIGNVKSFSLSKTLFYSVVTLTRSMLTWIYFMVISGAQIIQIMLIVLLISLPFLFLNSGSLFVGVFVISYLFGCLVFLMCFSCAFYHMVTQVVALSLPTQSSQEKIHE